MKNVNEKTVETNSEENSEKNEKSRGGNDTNEIQDDINKKYDDDDIDDKELPQFTDEQMESIDETALKNSKVSDADRIKEKPNFNALAEYEKRVCIMMLINYLQLNE